MKVKTPPPKKRKEKKKQKNRALYTIETIFYYVKGQVLLKNISQRTVL